MIDYITIHKRGEDAWDVCDERGRIAAIRSRLDDKFQPTGAWFIRIDRPERPAYAHLYETDQLFGSFQAAFAHICQRVLA
ncbi:hypothetical protein HOU03_gp425 [Caulobacter phage CcrSC]|uniref:Uncharacterized protein n=1 Tax=Caulobacter phage CcrSC TaxID=2283272 RepID=A0A385EDK4_9CAUD|nr:hypothetical protein HOU03_gp425 [Caulobacter phage CcrSC]AXQ69843.1 hypothetical protein CcrSC_gp261c [Caulobacter phage CcrSC]